MSRYFFQGNANFFSVVCLLLIANVFAQNTSSWYFGQNAGIKFMPNGTITALTDGQINTSEGCASVSNQDGNLLFYTDGVTVYDKNHQVMQNGNDLMGEDSSTQSSLIVPKPLSSTIYYVFTLDSYAGVNGFRYSVVDMSLNNGIGAVTDKNILVYSPSNEKISVTQHANGQDFWVVTHGWGNNSFISYKLTPVGLELTPVVSSTGIVVDGSTDNVWGYLKISPDGKRLAVAHSLLGAQLFDFDNQTGIVSNPIDLFTDASSYGVEFSPDSKKLYLSVTNPSPFKILQFDLNSPDIPASRFDFSFGSIIPAALQLGPDGIVYFGEYERPYLGKIQNPNALGPSCGIIENAVSLNGRLCDLGLPSFVSSFFDTVFTFQNGCLGDETQFTILDTAGILSVDWDFGDGNSSSDIHPSHLYANPGNYIVSLNINHINGNIAKTRMIIISSFPESPSIIDFRQCDDETSDGHTTFDLTGLRTSILNQLSSSSFSVDFYESSQDADDDLNPLPLQYVNTSNPEVIYIRISNLNNRNCYIALESNLEVIILPLIDLLSQYGICDGNPTQISAPNGFDQYQWSTGETSQTIQISTPGDYWLNCIINNDGNFCQKTHSFSVNGSGIPSSITTETHNWTNDQNGFTLHVEGMGEYEYSLDGENFQVSNTFSGLIAGNYTVYIQDRLGCGSTTETITLLDYPRFFTPNGDGINDIWQIKMAQAEPDMQIEIYDRYGKFLSDFKGNDPGWNGQLNGKNLPANDYWFVIKRKKQEPFKGHFSLVR